MYGRAELDVTSEERKAEVRRLDPLGLDDDLRLLSKMNEAGDISSLVRVFARSLPSAQAVAGFSPAECLAAMRDLGMYIGSLKRHGLSPFEIVPRAAGACESLGRRTGMIPRDTVYHYTCWNPVGERERLYTGHPMERCLVDAVRTCIPDLARAVDLGHALRGDDPCGPAYAGRVLALASYVSSADRAMGDVAAQVAPEFFALVLRPYFEDVHISGRRYMGPAAAHVPLFLIDTLLWSSDRCAPQYGQFCDEAAAHTLPHWRQWFSEWSRVPSVTSRVARALGGSCAPADMEHIYASAQGLRQALRSLTRFRGKHLVMARRAYHEEVRLYDLGSGGGSVGLLAEILTLTRQNATMVGALGPR
ncbi:MAG: DUF1864 family protein [Thermoactinospora sp.]|nr:DUF1864 family protein [Thermoactinospora sp.]